MKYARKAQYGSETRLVDVVRILPQHQADPDAWLAKQFPGYTGWFQLMQDVSNGAVEQLDGSFTQPSVAASAKPIVYRWDTFNKYLIGLLNPNGRAKLQTILESARDFAGTDSPAKLTRSFYTWFVGTTEFEKDETAEMLQYLVDSSIVTVQQRTAVLNGWAEKPVL